MDSLENRLEHLLNELCVDLGFCLPAEKRRGISRRERVDALEFAFAVLAAEGLQPEYEKQWVDTISARFRKEFGSDSVSADQFKV